MSNLVGTMGDQVYESDYMFERRASEAISIEIRGIV